MFSETYPPSLTFTGFMQKTKRSAATMDPEQLLAFSARPRSRKRKSLPDITDPLSLSQSCGIPEEPSLILNTLSEEEVEEDLQKLLSSSLDDLPLDSISSSQLSTVTPTPTSSEDQFEKSSEAGLPKTTPTPRSSASSTSPTAKRPNASSSFSTPALAKPQLQFINKSAPAMSRPKPQQGAGVYVQTQSAIQQRVRKRLREEGKVKRSSNCFIKYRTYMHPIIVARFGNQNNKEISRLAGRCWKNEPESVKSIYRQQAAEEKAYA
ncbi:hypothetical protein BGX23_002420 [Mortierella sp. AD031]|nr:hypothetical protein BGX23_002420 [Mortierella sp. AD031]